MRVLDILKPPLVAIDIGTATTRVSFGNERFVQRPSMVREQIAGTAVERRTIRGGVVSDIAGTADVLSTLLGSSRRWRRRPGAIVCTPSDSSVQEREALIESVNAGGATVVAVVPEPLAAAVGSGVDVASEYATAIVDLGEGVTDFAVFRSGAIVRSEAKRVGCASLRAALRDWLELRQRERALPPDETIEAIVRAYCESARRALPSSALNEEDLESLLEPAIDEIARFIDDSVRHLPDALAAEVIESGMHVSGGGAKLERLVARIAKRTGLQLKCAGDPLTAVIRGAAEMLGNRKLLGSS